MKDLSNGRGHQSNFDLVRYLDRSIKIDFQEVRKYLGQVNFRCERGLFAEVGTPATNNGRRLHTPE